VPYQVIRTPAFNADVERLSKKFRRLSQDLEAFLPRLAEHPRDIGDPIALYPRLLKTRVNVPSARVDRRGGLRLLYRVDDTNELIWLVMLFDKRDMADVTAKELKRAVENVRPFFEAELVRRGLDPKKIRL
jgi:mRNA-degrading endonuclease RelE of RelBE toxin-antitoxin system